MAIVLVLMTLAAVAPPVRGDDGVYARRHFDLQTVPWGALMYDGINPGQAAPDPPLDRSGIPLRSWGGRYWYVADRIARQGLYRLNGYVRSGDVAYTSVLQAFDSKLRAMAQPVADAWFYPWPFSYPGEALSAPWYNAMTQGLVLSFFSRMYEAYGDPADLDAAGHVFRSFEAIGSPVSSLPGPWVATIQAGFLWLEHYPGGVTGHVLNAHLWATFGLYDYWRQLTRIGSVDVIAVRAVLEGAITTIRSNVWRYRRPGRTSLYALVHRTSYLHYHLLHISQLRLLAKISGDPYFASMADLFWADSH